MLDTVARTRPREPWRPIPGSSQELALDTRCNETLFCGSRGPGKTDTQLMRFYRRVGVGYGAFWRGIIFDREYKNLDDIVSKSRRWFSNRGDGGKFIEGTSNYYWIWPTGEMLYFRTLKRDSDYWDYHGQEYAFIGWNELCKFPTGELYSLMMSCNRSSWTREKDAPLDENDQPIDLPPIPLEVFSTANPYGPGHGWVKRMFIDPVPYGEIQSYSVEVFNPQKQHREVITRTRVAIFGSYRENIYLDPQYVANLEGQSDKSRKQAWLKGDWNIVAGGAFDDVFESDTHIVYPFQIPSGWRVDRSFDWGSSKPFACLWYAEANGEEVQVWNGMTFVKWAPPKGTIFIIDELYGADHVGTNVGNKWAATKVAQHIKFKDDLLYSSKRVLSPVMPGPADNEIRNVRSRDTATIEALMASEGVRWEPSDKAPGSRIVGFELARDRLVNAQQREGPGLYFFRDCRLTLSCIPSLPRDDENQDDVDTEAEDHLWDALRYRILKSANRIVKDLKVNYPA